MYKCEFIFNYETNSFPVTASSRNSSSEEIATVKLVRNKHICTSVSPFTSTFQLVKMFQNYYYYYYYYYHYYYYYYCC